MPQEQKAVTVSAQQVAQVKHAIKPAKLLFSAPTFILRGPIWLIFVIVIIGVFYACVTKIPQRVYAPLTLTADFTEISAPVGGIVNRVYVGSGSEVGLDPTPLIDIQFKTRASSGSETEKLREQLEQVKDALEFSGKEKKDRDARIAGMRDTLREERKNQVLLEESIANEKKALDGNLKDAASRVATIQKSAESTKVELGRLKANIVTASITLRKATEGYEREVKMLKDKLTTKDAVDNLELKKVNSEQNLVNAKSAVAKIKNDIVKLQLQMQTALSEPAKLRTAWDSRKQAHNQERTFKKERISSLQFDIKRQNALMKEDRRVLEKKRDKLEKLIEKSQDLIPGVKYIGDLCKINSTYGMTVIESHVKPGQTISYSQPLFVIKKNTDRIYADIMIANREVSKIEEGMEVKIKYEAYSYQYWGVAKGKISMIPKTPIEHPQLGSVYKVKVALEKITISKPSTKEKEAKKAKKETDLALGLRGLAEIKIKSKLLIVLIFGPLEAWLNPED